MKTKLVGLLLVALGLAGGVFAAKGLERLVHETDLRSEPPPCFEIGAGFHHRFRAGCSELMNTPRGPLRFSTNGEGIRDLYKASIVAQPKRYLVMGDSFVEGWWASSEQTISAALNARFPAAYFINGGLRSTGPLMQAKRLQELLEAYRPAGVIWILNDTDGLDDRLACAVLKEPEARLENFEFGTPEFELTEMDNTVAALLGQSPLGQRLRRRSYERKWKALVHSNAAGRCGGCRGISEFRKVADMANVPLLAFYLAPVSSAPLAHYEGEKSSREELLECLKTNGIDFSLAGSFDTDPVERERNYWEGDFHLNPEGVMKLVDEISPAVVKWLGRTR